MEGLMPWLKGNSISACIAESSVKARQFAELTIATLSQGMMSCDQLFTFRPCGNCLFEQERRRKKDPYLKPHL